MKLTIPSYLQRSICLTLLTTFGSAYSVTSSAEDQGWHYGARGLEWADAETESYLWLGLRAQTRASNFQDDLRDLEDFHQSGDSGAWVNRSRYKIGAGLRTDATFYHEYDLRNSRLLDLRATWTTYPGFKVRAGQWKSEYNRARIDSSGQQQFIERSIATYWFTIDRQWGVSASGRLAQDTTLDTSWWAGVLAGNGRNGESDGGKPMLYTRWQWNYTGTLLPFSQSALKRYQKPHGSLAIGAVANESKYTRFSSAGGGSLPGYTVGADNQYRIYQGMQEWAWHHRGFSFQQELHYKQITDRITHNRRDLYGGYVQVGWFPSDFWPDLPRQFEIAGRLAAVSANDFQEKDDREASIAANWFFNGHRNKLTFEASYIRVEEEEGRNSDLRFTVQWDLSI